MMEINYALVEDKRPPLYTAMKYWGKKPHNIWREFIKTYTPENGIYLDPFAGSAVSAFEAVKAGRKAIAFDLNPLTSFIIESCCSLFNEMKFLKAAENIIEDINQNPIYNQYFTTKCRKCGYQNAILQHSKWEANIVYEIGIICTKCNCGKNIRYLSTPTPEDLIKCREMNELAIDRWIPDDKFYLSPTFSKSFIGNIKGTSWSDIWTRRNLYVLAKLFDLILKHEDEYLKKQLLFAFVQTIHLCSKMCIPRRAEANRAFSTSWGRAAYICSTRQMEMNPLLLFKGNCFGKQSVRSCLNNVRTYLNKIPKIQCVNESTKNEGNNDYDIMYGIVDINNIDNYLKSESVDFILTDPPYGGLVQYLDLSNLWLVWLQRYDKKYKPNIDAEITIKKGVQDLNNYGQKITGGLKKLHKILKTNGKIVFTFNNNDLQIWNTFLKSLLEAGFQIEHVIHQQNRRTGESNVSDPYGTSATDFYIRCIKIKSAKSVREKHENFEKIVVRIAVKIIRDRNEPTPFQILFNGLLAELSRVGFEMDNFDSNIQTILSKHLGTLFTITDNKKNGGGKFWWLRNGTEINEKKPTLSDRVQKDIITILKSRNELTCEDIYAQIFRKYPNHLTPGVKIIDYYIKKNAQTRGNKLIFKNS